MGGRAIDIGVDYVLMPSMIYKSTFRSVAKVDENGQPTGQSGLSFGESQTDLNLNLQYNNEIWGGVGVRGLTLREFSAFLFNFGAHITKQVSVGYAYDLTVSSIGDFSGGSHEFLLKYRLLNFGIGQNRPETTYCPRHM